MGEDIIQPKSFGCKFGNVKEKETARKIKGKGRVN
jgi:hypothetical protein